MIAAMDTKAFEVICPCCGAAITVDPDTRVIIAHAEPRKRAHLSLEEAALQVKAGRKEAESRFARAMDERAHQSEILEKRFKKALEKAADEPEGPPPKPFDLD
jgi:hypothetical protein